MASADLSLSVPLPEALKAISSVLRVQLVEAANMTATYYGRYMLVSPQESHVCVYVKARKDDPTALHVDVKTCFDALSAKLVKELERAL